MSVKVLHDLLMRRPLFEDFVTPYARLVRAVEREVPRIDAPQADAGLRLLAQNCLAKIPRQRLDTVKWENFSQPEVTDPLDSARRRIAQRRTAAEQVREREVDTRTQLDIQLFALRTSIQSAIVSTITTESLPRYSTQKIRDSNPFLLRVLFEPSPNHGLTHHFALYCSGTVLDASASVQELRVSACASRTRETVPAEPEPNTPANVVKGALIDQDVRTHIQKCLLLAYAETLEITSPPKEQVQWVNVGGDT